MHLVVHQVVQLHHVDVAHCRKLFERLARPSIVQLSLSVCGQPGFRQGLMNVGFRCAIKDRRDGLEAERGGGPAQVGFKNLPHVHTTGNAQGVEQDL